MLEILVIWLLVILFLELDILVVLVEYCMVECSTSNYYIKGWKRFAGDSRKLATILSCSSFLTDTVNRDDLRAFLIAQGALDKGALDKAGAAREGSRQ